MLLHHMRVMRLSEELDGCHRTVVMSVFCCGMREDEIIEIHMYLIMSGEFI